MGMSTMELAYEYSRGEITESSLLSIFSGNEELVANIVSIALTLTPEDKEVLEKVTKSYR